MTVFESANPRVGSVPEGALTECLRELRNCVVLRTEPDLFENFERGVISIFSSQT